MSLLVGPMGKAPGGIQWGKPWKLWLSQGIYSQKTDWSENEFWTTLYHINISNKQIDILKNAMKDCWSLKTS